MSLIKDIKLFFFYSRIIKKKENIVKLKSDFNARVDNADRIYGVINIPTELIGDEYNLRKYDVERLSQTYVKEYMTRLSSFLNSLGLTEMYTYYEPIERVEKYAWKFVIGYKQIDSVFINTLIWRRLVPFGLFLILIVTMMKLM